MVDMARAQGAFTVIMDHFVEQGSAPHFTELARPLGITVSEARETLRDLEEVVLGVFCAHDTDYLAAFPPFSNLPTHNRISVDGVQRWYGQ